MKSILKYLWGIKLSESIFYTAKIDQLKKYIQQYKLKLKILHLKDALEDRIIIK